MPLILPKSNLNFMTVQMSTVSKVLSAKANFRVNKQKKFKTSVVHVSDYDKHEWRELWHKRQTEFFVIFDNKTNKKSDVTC